MVKIGVVGLGKMGASHFAIVNAHPLTETVVCDQTGLILDAMNRYTGVPTFKDYDEMLATGGLDAVLIATPSKHHAPMVRKALEAGVHVFCEKPFCLNYRDSEQLADLAEQKGLINHVGYHYRHVSTFQEAKRIIDSGALGDITHVLAEAYGPVVLRPKGSTWRTSAAEGGGCLYDYSAHPINLVNWYFGAPNRVLGTVFNSIYSAQTEDEVYSTFYYPSGMSVHLSTNWSDESYRKMSTKISVTGSLGRLVADRLEVQVYLREDPPAALQDGYRKGWNIKYLTDFDTDIQYYLRGEEYSEQIDQFVRAVAEKNTVARCDFRSAAVTDRTIAMMTADSKGETLEGAPQVEPAAQSAGQRVRAWLGFR